MKAPKYWFAVKVEASAFSFAIKVRSGTRKNGIWSSPPTKTRYLRLGCVLRIESTVAESAVATAFARSGEHGSPSHAS